jgi:hypothetical protein
MEGNNEHNSNEITWKKVQYNIRMKSLGEKRKI